MGVKYDPLLGKLRTTDVSSGSGTGTVTSVDVSGGTTGLTTSGGPVTSSGTITLAGTLAVANGGTGSATKNFVDLTTAQTVAGLKTFSSAIAVTGNSNINGTLNLNISSASNFSGGLSVQKQGATGDATATVVNGGEVGYHNFLAWGGSAYKRLAYTIVRAVGDVSSATAGGTYSISTRSSVDGTELERIRIDMNGLYPVGNATYTLGTSSLYWSNLYATRHYLNATSYLDGGTAGIISAIGDLRLAADPTVALGAATKQYVDNGLAAKAPLASPTFTGTVTVPTTTNATDAASKSYVDGVAQGLSVKASVQEATAAALPTNTYLAGVITITATGTLTVDGQLVALNDRVLVKNEVAGANNGIYLCTTAGAIGVAAVLTRATDSNTGAKILGGFVFVELGTANAAAGFVNTNASAPTIGTTAITYTQFSGAGEITASTGLTKTGNTLTIDTSITVDKTTTQTLSGKTLTSPTLTTPAIGAATGTSLSVSGQLTSTVAIGTAPLVVTSTTNVPNLNADTVDGMHGAEVAPVGSMTMFAGSAAPGGWLICDGSSLLRTSYAALFTVIGTTFGTVDGTHFTLPDMRGSTPLGVGTSTAAGATAHTLGQVGGEETHTMTTGELVAHTHKMYPAGSDGNIVGGGASGAAANLSQTASAFRVYSNVDGGSTGSTTPFNELPPYVGLNYIIKSR